jgi:hypothetical protein
MFQEWAIFGRQKYSSFKDKGQPPTPYFFYIGIKGKVIFILCTINISDLKNTPGLLEKWTGIVPT